MDSIIVGRIYQHFKGNLYLVTGMNVDSETRYCMVEYTALYGRCLRYSRKLVNFISVLDKEGKLIKTRTDNITGQLTCFELVGDGYGCKLEEIRK